MAASIGATIEAGTVVPLSHDTALKIYQRVSFHYSVRATMVRMLFYLVGKPGAPGAQAGTLTFLLAWSEMNHIRMVQDYVFERYLEVLTMRELQGSTLGILDDAWNYLNELAPGERAYAKLLFPPHATKSLQRDRFILLVDAAHAIGNHIYASFTNYGGYTRGTLGTGIKRRVTSYLQSLEEPGTTLTQAAHYATIDGRILDCIPGAAELYGARKDTEEEDLAEAARE